MNFIKSNFDPMKFQKKILVIEDDQNLGHTIQNILTLHHYDVSYATNGASGIQKAFHYNPDIILCDINMDPVNGYQVYKVLEESSILNRIPFIFITGNSDIDRIRFGMSLGADDYIVKPFKNDDLIQSIEKRLEKFQTMRDEANLEFKRLFNISPYGIILFDGSKIVKANPAFLNKIDYELTSFDEMRIDNFLNEVDLQKLKLKISENRSEKSEIFNDEITLETKIGQRLQLNLIVSEFEKFSNYTLYIGLFVEKLNSVIPSESQYADEVQNLLKRENIRISEALGEKITNIFKQKTINCNCQNNTFYTKRENQVLCLSMEGLPIKLIADRLDISDRTVEKYRTKLMEKSGANNMIEVIVFALKKGLIEI